jgi:hypothetical protein
MESRAVPGQHPFSVPAPAVAGAIPAGQRLRIVVPNPPHAAVVTNAAVADPVAAETHSLVLQTQELVHVTFILVCVTAAAIVLPIIIDAVRRHFIERDDRARAYEVVETIALVLESQLRAVERMERTRSTLTAGSEFLVARILDPAITRHLHRGTFDMLMHAVSSTYGVLTEARSSLPQAFSRLDSPMADYDISTEHRDMMKGLSESAAACIIMLRHVRSRLESRSRAPFINWETERDQLRD